MSRFIFLFLISLFQCFIIQAEQRDTRTREYILPTRIVWQQNSEQIKNADCLLQNSSGQADLINNNVCKIENRTDKQSSILLDFGKEIQGGLQFVTGYNSSNKPIKIRVRLGESVGEAMCEIDGINGATNDHALRDFEIQLPWLGVAETAHSGFRFARIDIIGDIKELQLKEIRAVSIYRDIPYKGSFRSNDERLNQIWQTGAYTVHVNMQEYLWDGIKRDRLVWIGDMHPEVMTINSVFGYNEVVPKSLDFIRDITKLPSWMNGISSYSIWWLLIHRDWYYYQGNLEYLKQQEVYITDLLKLLISKVDNEGIENLDGSRFLDWPSNEHKEAINAGLQALMLQAMNSGEELLSILGNKELALQCQQTAIRIVNAAPKASSAFLASTKKPYEPGSKQGAALLALAGLFDAKEANDKYLSQEGARGFSTFYGYYMLKAMSLAGNYEGALNIIRTYWGAMLDLGATTFWEDFNMDWLENAARIDEITPDGKIDIHKSYGGYCYKGYRHSLSHGWASGPTAWLSEYVLGVQVVEPGCKVIRITPHLGDLEWVEGSFPTPYGTVEIKHKKLSNGKISSDIKAPKGVKVLSSNK